MYKKHKKRNRFIILIVVVIIVVIATRSRGKEDLTPVTTERVSTRDITEMVSGSGRIYPEVEVKISSDVSGEIIEMYVSEGDSVEQGQLLCRINPELYESALAQMRASLNNSKATLATSEAQMSRVKANFVQQKAAYERQQKLFRDQVISKQDFELSEAAYLMSEAELLSAEKNIMAARYAVESAAARLEESVRNFGRTSIYSPIKGMVTSMSVEKGERVVGTSQMAGTEMMRISVLDFMEIRVDVNENDIIRIKSGDTALIEVDAYRRQQFKGVVSHVARSVRSAGMGVADNQQAVNYEVRMRILPGSYQHLITKDRTLPFWPGMTGSVDIITRTEKEVLAVPISSVTLRESSGTDTLSGLKSDSREVVFVYEGEEKGIVMKTVKTGIQDGDYIKIMEGLKEGEEVISGPYGAIANDLFDGSKVKVVTKDELFKVKKK
jgi:HlyD family secretion protein